MRKVIFVIIFYFTGNLVFSEDEFSKVKDVFEKAAKRIYALECLADATTYHYEKNIGTKEIKIYAKQPDKLRIEFLAPPSMKGGFIIFDGKTIYQYIPKMKKALKIDLKNTKLEKTKDDITTSRSLDTQLASITNLVAKDLKDFWEKNEFVYLGKEKIQNRELYKVQIMPRKKTSLKAEQIIWIDVNDGLTWKIDFKIELFGREEIIQMKEIKTNTEIPDGLFEYKGEIL